MYIHIHLHIKRSNLFQFFSFRLFSTTTQPPRNRYSPQARYAPFRQASQEGAARALFYKDGDPKPARCTFIALPLVARDGVLDDLFAFGRGLDFGRRSQVADKGEFRDVAGGRSREGASCSPRQEAWCGGGCAAGEEGHGVDGFFYLVRFVRCVSGIFFRLTIEYTWVESSD